MMRRIFLVAFMVTISFSPVLAGAQDSGLIPCGLDRDNNKIVEEHEQCHFEDLFRLGMNVIRFLITLSIPVAGIGFAYAGFLMVTSGGSEKNRDRAKEIFSKVGIGFLFLIAAWLIVWFITTTLLDSEYILLQGGQ